MVVDGLGKIPRFTPRSQVGFADGAAGKEENPLNDKYTKTV